MIHDTFTLLQQLESCVLNRSLVSISQIFQFNSKMSFNVLASAAISEAGFPAGLGDRCRLKWSKSRATTANRSFPRPSRRSALRGLESAAARVHEAHRYRHR